jgi:hypothetical protein
VVTLPLGVSLTQIKFVTFYDWPNYSCRDIGQRFSNISVVTQMLLRMRAG